MVEAKIDPEKKVLFLLMFFMLIVGIYGTYAFFSAQSQSSEQTVTTGSINISFDDNTSIVRNENIAPIDESDIFTSATKKSFTIKNIGTEIATTTLTLSITDITEELKSPDFKWALYEGNTKIAENSFDNIGNNNSIVLKNDILLDENEAKTYDLYIWIKETGVPQNELQGGKLISTIIASATQ